jgi:hypothetical protein
MAYTYTAGVDGTKPAGSDTANVDDDIRATKLAYNERLTDLFGVTMSADPLVPTKVGSALQLSSAQAKATYYNAGNTSTALTIDWNNGNSQKCTLTGNVTFTLSNPVAGSWYSLECIQDGTGGRTMTLPATVRWTNGSSAPTFTTTAARVTLLSLYYTGTVYLVSMVGTGYNVS